MKKHFIALSIVLALASGAHAQTINLLGAGAAVSGTDLYPTFQTANPAKRVSAAQVAAYVWGLMSGDATASGTGVVNFKTVNANVGTFGSATLCTVVTINAKGLITAASQVTCTPAMSSVTGRAALSQLPQGIANSIWINPTGSTADMQNIAVPACANDGAHALTYVNGTGLQCASITAGGAVSSVTSGIGVTVTPTTGAVVVSTPVTGRNTTTATDTITSADKGTLVTESNSASVAVAVTIAGFVNTDYFSVKNLNTGVATYTPSSGNIDGAATLVCQKGQSSDLYFDGTNLHTLSNNCSANTPTITVASGTMTLGTSAIASGACATVVTVSATGVTTTDRVKFSYNSDPTAVTGYGASATGAVLTIYPYPTSNNVNAKVCNSSASSITPSAITLNWDVQR